MRDNAKIINGEIVVGGALIQTPNKCVSLQELQNFDQFFQEKLNQKDENYFSNYSCNSITEYCDHFPYIANFKYNKVILNTNYSFNMLNRYILVGLPTIVVDSLFEAGNDVFHQNITPESWEKRLFQEREDKKQKALVPIHDYKKPI